VLGVVHVGRDGGGELDDGRGQIEEMVCIWTRGRLFPFPLFFRACPNSTMLRNQV